jgi:hypothetical protein
MWCYLDGRPEDLMLEEEPLGPVEARQLVRRILRSDEGQLVFSEHALAHRMADRAITEDEVFGCLARGFCGSNITYERGTWRYPIETPDLVVVVAFDTETMAIVITTWRRR